ncbi:hypothetical protein CL654_00475 [bacterium]|nr:hypothetical protein [bacterium]
MVLAGLLFVLGVSFISLNNFSPETQTAQVVPSNLVLYFPMDTVTGNDSSPSGTNGTVVGSPTVIPGQVGNALSFDGVDDFINFSDGPLNQTESNGVSAATWV